MKLKIVVVDLEVSPRVKKWALRIGIPLGVLLGGGAVAWAGLTTWNPGDTLTAAALNANFAALDTRLSAVETTAAKVTAWASYSAVVKAGGVTLATGATTGAYWRRVGDTMEVRLTTDFTACTSTGILTWSLPPSTNPDTGKMPAPFSTIGNGLQYENSANNVRLLAVTYDPGDGIIAGTDMSGGTPMQCSDVPAGSVRLNFTVPIQGWTVTGP